MGYSKSAKLQTGEEEMNKKYKPELETKCWGKVQHIFANPSAAVSKPQVEPGWMCSRHYHRDRYNMFAVTSGAIAVEEWQYGVKALTLLGAGEVLTVPPGVLHRFRVWRRGNLTEVYWPKDSNCVCDINDIVRLDTGGPDEGLEEELKEAGLI